MININTATGTATDLPHPLIQTLSCHEKKTQIEHQARFCETKLSELDNPKSVCTAENTAQDRTFHSQL